MKPLKANARGCVTLYNHLEWKECTVNVRRDSVALAKVVSALSKKDTLEP